MTPRGSHTAQATDNGTPASPRKRKRNPPRRVVPEPTVLQDDAVSTASSDSDLSESNGTSAHLLVDEQPAYQVIEFDDESDSDDGNAATTRTLRASARAGAHRRLQRQGQFPCTRRSGQ